MILKISFIPNVCSLIRTDRSDGFPYPAISLPLELNIEREIKDPSCQIAERAAQQFDWCCIVSFRARNTLQMRRKWIAPSSVLLKLPVCARNLMYVCKYRVYIQIYTHKCICKIRTRVFFSINGSILHPEKLVAWISTAQVVVELSSPNEKLLSL